MLGYNRIITRTNVNVLINIGPGAGGGRKSRGKKSNPPNTFDDDCRLVIFVIVSIVPIFSKGYSRAKLFIDYFS